MTPTSTIDVRRAADRFHTRIGWLDSRHSFSFSHHYDPANTGHGLLIVSNDDRVAPGAGFSAHPHRDMEIVTWVLEGRLEHSDSEGNHGVLYPGLAQRMSAGRGIVHAEMNASASEPVHFVQMWVVPDTVGIDPGYEPPAVDARLDGGGLVPVASGRGHEAAVAIHQAGAAMWVGRLADGEAVEVPDAPYVHLFVARGSVRLGGGAGGDVELAEGDAVRLTAAGALPVVASAASEIIVWESDAEVRR